MDQVTAGRDILGKAHFSCFSVLSFPVSRWIQHKAMKDNWDFAALYYGADPSFSCPECVAVQRLDGAKWHLVYEFLMGEDWKILSSRYSSVMIPDNDLIMTADVISEFFDVFHERNLTIGQPSLCQPCSYTAWPVLYQQKGNLLRYTSFVELMTPTFSTEFLNTVVRETIEDAHIGWGLDHVWPLLLGFSKTKVGVVDAVCIVHPGDAAKGGKLYQIPSVPRSAKTEQRWNQERWGYTRWALWSHGLRWQQPVTWSTVRLPDYEIAYQATAWKEDACAGLPANVDAERQAAQARPGLNLFLAQVGVLALVCLIVASASHAMQGLGFIKPQNRLSSSVPFGRWPRSRNGSASDSDYGAILSHGAPGTP